MTVDLWSLYVLFIWQIFQFSKFIDFAFFFLLVKLGTSIIKKLSVCYILSKIYKHATPTVGLTPDIYVGVEFELCRL